MVFEKLCQQMRDVEVRVWFKPEEETPWVVKVVAESKDVGRRIGGGGGGNTLIRALNSAAAKWYSRDGHKGYDNYDEAVERDLENGDRSFWEPPEIS